jgi:exosortase
MTLPRRTALFGVYSLCLMLANLGVLRALVELARNNATASHHLLIPLVTLALMFHRRDVIFSDVRSDWRAGAGVVLAGLGLALWSSRYGPPGGPGDALSAMVGAFVALWVGGFLLFYGRGAFGAALFPLLFLGFMIPMPGALIDGATLFLKTGSSVIAGGLFTLTGTPYHREGFVFSLPRFAIEIADECSGIRSSIALLLTSLLAGHLFLESRWKKVLLVAAVLPLAVVKNGVRIVSLSLLAMHVNPGFLTGQLHHEGGIVFFILVLPILALILALLGRSEMAQKCGARRA